MNADETKHLVSLCHICVYLRPSAVSLFFLVLVAASPRCVHPRLHRPSGVSPREIDVFSLGLLGAVAREPPLGLTPPFQLFEQFGAAACLNDLHLLLANAVLAVAATVAERGPRGSRVTLEGVERRQVRGFDITLMGNQHSALRRGARVNETLPILVDRRAFTKQAREPVLFGLGRDAAPVEHPLKRKLEALHRSSTAPPQDPAAR
jgi:hypothetical protein